jgi:hypothetical protein
VLARPCPECGFDASMFPCRSVAATLRANVAEWRRLLERPDAGRRPSEWQWSALEYGCHVRDVFRLYRIRLGRMLAEDDPLFENWDQDHAAIDGRYGAQDPEVVANEVEAAGEELAAAFEVVPEDAWARPGRRSDGAAFTIDTFARYLLHDPVHHVWDVRNGFERVAGREPRDSKLG